MIGSSLQCRTPLGSGARQIFLLLFLPLFAAACSQTPAEKGSRFRMAIANEPPTLDWTLATDSVSFDISF